MLVYRLCKEEEYNSIMNTKSYDDIGSVCNKNRWLNNHSYQPNQKYLHFFKDFDSIFYCYLKEGTYVCTYELPDELLEQYAGIGKYVDRMFMRKHEMVTEYAIPNEKISFIFLRKIERVNQSIDFEDYLADEYQDFLETVYNREQKPHVLIKEDINRSEKM